MDGRNDESLADTNIGHERVDRLIPHPCTYPRHKLIHEVFEEQVERTPDVTAVVYEGHALTYAELNGRANQLARYLRNKGVGPDRLVAICFDRSVEMVVGLLAVLKAGGAYVPLDPLNPAARLEQMLADSGPVVVLTQSPLSQRVQFVSVGGKVLLDATPWNDSVWGAFSKVNLRSRETGLTPSHLAYVIYTSGSTGTPKGVMVEHANVMNFLSGLEACIHGLKPNCRHVAWNSSIGFDMAAKAWGQILHGRTVYIVPDPVRIDADGMLAFLERHGIEAMECTPSHLRMMRAAGFLAGRAEALRKLLLGGEAIDAVTWQLLAAAADISFFNMYGPTECSVDASCSEVVGDVPHVGTPMPNARIHVLDEQMRPSPPGIAGEIYIGGSGVARGYLKRPDLTAERFLPEPFNGNALARMYKSGDVGQWSAEGKLEYLGRNDQQVKIRGYRIELGEIEMHLTRHLDVRDVVVIAEDQLGEPRLVAYLTAQANSRPNVDALRNHLRRFMPEHMVPCAFVILNHLPMTLNGKLDRRALPAPDREACGGSSWEPPEGEIENVLAQVWREVLHVDRVGRRENFFELGGHSLMATRAAIRIGQVLDLDVPLHVIFEGPTIERLSSWIMRELTADVSMEMES